MKRVIFALLVIIIVTSAQAKYSGGTGTESNPYQIGSISDWNDLMYTPSDWDANFIMIADINLQGVPLIPVGNDLNGTSIFFKGVFDGYGHVIRNAAINMPGHWHIGLFGLTDTNSQIRNLGVEDVNMNGERDVAGLAGINNFGIISNCYVTGKVAQYSSGSSHSCLGGLVGLNYGTITGSHATCDVNGNETKIGGLVGRNYGGAIINSYANGTVNGGSYVGGLVGENAFLPASNGNGPDYSYPGTITRCYAMGSVTGNLYVGGLVGANGDYPMLRGHLITGITDCYSTCAVKGGAGLLGFNLWSFTNCYAAGKVDANGGGLISPPLPPAPSYLNCFWDINATGQTQSGGGIGKTTAQMQTLSTFVDANWDFNNVWHICEGHDYPKLNAFGAYSGGSGTSVDPYQIFTPCDLMTLANDINDYNKCFVMTADIDLDPNLPGNNDYNSAVIAKNNNIGIYASYVGTPFTGVFDGDGHKIINLTIGINRIEQTYIGLFGYIGVGGQVKNLGVTNFYRPETWDSCMGAIAGYNAGSLTNCFATGAINGGYYVVNVGGLVGYNDGDITGCCSSVNINVCNCEYSDNSGGLAGGNDSNGYISNSFANGNIKGPAAGGAVGWNNGNIINCYSTCNVNDGYGRGFAYYNDGSIVSCYFLNTAGPNNGYGTPLTDAQMKQQASFVGWDFATIWAICEGTNYPRLLWQIPAADLICPGGVNFVDYSFFVNRWTNTNCAANNDCDGTDFDSSGTVDLADLKVFCNYWLQGL